jgi:hypothetical protein
VNRLFFLAVLCFIWRCIVVCMHLLLVSTFRRHTSNSRTRAPTENGGVGICCHHISKVYHPELNSTATIANRNLQDILC